jgi:hypothetical protein
LKFQLERYGMLYNQNLEFRASNFKKKLAFFGYCFHNYKII